jgi:hypothetical protein
MGLQRIIISISMAIGSLIKTDRNHAQSNEFS